MTSNYLKAACCSWLENNHNQDELKYSQVHQYIHALDPKLYKTAFPYLGDYLLLLTKTLEHN